MNIQALCSDIKARLTADTTTYGLFPTGGTPLVNGIFAQFAAPNLFLPYIVVDAASAVQDDCFAVDKIDFSVVINVFADKSTEGLTTAQKILERIYGDGIRHSDRLPTYGLHRYKLTYTTTGVVDKDIWYYTNMVRQSSRTQHEDNYYHFIEVYSVSACRDVTTTA